ncbi:MAG: hypothetical protein WC389_12360 [Lutibacter sp.]
MALLDEIHNEPQDINEPYQLSNAANVTDLLDEMDLPVEQFEQNNSSSSSIIDEPQTAVEENKESDLTSAFLVFAIDKIVDQSCKLISKDRDHDFSMSASERKDLESQAKAMMKGKSVMPPWARFATTALMIIVAKGFEAYELKKERDLRIQAETDKNEALKRVADLEKEIAEMKKTAA